MSRKIKPIFIFLFFISCTRGSIQQRYLNAEKLWNSGDYQAAASEFEFFYESTPDSALGIQSLFRAGMTRKIFLKDHKKALEDFEVVIEKTKNKDLKKLSQKHYLDLIYSTQKNCFSVLSFIESILVQDLWKNEKSELLVKKADCLTFLKRFEEAQETLEQVPESENFWFYQSKVDRLKLLLLKANDRDAQSSTTVPEEDYCSKIKQKNLMYECVWQRAELLSLAGQAQSAILIFEDLKKNNYRKKIAELKINKIKKRSLRQNQMSGPQ